MKNPFADGEHSVLRPAPTALIIFGASGDLTNRKLVPALYNLAHDEYLPGSFIVMGASRTSYTDNSFRDHLIAGVTKHSRRAVKEDLIEEFSQQIFYQQLDGNNVADFKKLKQRLEKLGEERGGALNYVYYLATAPSHFATICRNLAAVGLVEDPKRGKRRTSVVVEKPFGFDLRSAKELNSKIRESFAEEQIYRIDHYLGKETVQNILVFRFANGIFEPLWNQKYIDHIQVSVCESIGVENRAAYFDNSGISRDIVQNHLLQMLALLCIEAPVSLNDADSIRDEKVKVLRSIRRIPEDQILNKSVRAQYTDGFINGIAVPSYLAEEGVSDTSSTETYMAMKLEIDNWRWAGVPIYIRAGKRLPKRITEIAIYFKKPPGALFHGRHSIRMDPNVLTIQVQPDEGISLKINSKPPGPRMRERPVVMDFSYGDSFGTASPDAYERLLLDTMKGDATLFTRDDEIEQAWELLMPVLNFWESEPQTGLQKYEAGSWGPEGAKSLLKDKRHTWRLL